MGHKGILVFGAESSGTRLWTEILIRAGCYGQSTHVQSMDAWADCMVKDRNLAWRRSLPHGKKWPLVCDMVTTMKSWNLDVHVLVTMRDYYSMIQSQLGARHVKTTDEARDNILRAYESIFSGVGRTGVPLVCASYEALIQRPEKTAGRTLDYLGLPWTNLILPDIKDANEKYAVSN